MAQKELKSGQVQSIRKRFGVLEAKEAGFPTVKTWLGSTASCDACEKLDGEERELDEPFVVVGAGPYSRIMHPPLHPNCQCTTEITAV